MGVAIRACHSVKPVEATWHGILPLTELDQIGVVTHIPTIYFYNNNVAIHNWLSQRNNTIINTLKDALSRALVPFYPLAGRLRRVDEVGGLELECNETGVELIEAETDKLISDFSEDFLSFENLIPRVDYSKSIEDYPLFLVQLTRFKCGGIAVCMSICHAITDGLSATHFIGEWARLARGEQLEDPPFLDRRILQANYDGKTCVSEVDFFHRLPTLIGGRNKTKDNNETVAVTLKLTKSQVDTLRMNANNMYGRFEVVAAHIWRCAFKARKHASEQMTTLCFCVDVRRRMNPPLPPRYFGNAIVDVSAYSQAQELISMPLSHTCRKIREANEKVTGDYVWSTIKFLQTQRKSNSQGGGYLNGDPNLITISSWLNLPVRGLDFGWGKETYMGPATHDFDGDIVILPGYINDGSVVVVAGLHVAHMKRFKQFFYEEVQILAQG